MPEPLHGVIRWKGPPAFCDAEYTCVHGISPGIIRVCVPAIDEWREQVHPIDAIDFTDGEQSFSLENVHIDSIEGEMRGDGNYYNITLFDRRWSWQFKQISGRYNERDRDGKIVKSSRAEVKRLAELCLEAMGEVNFDLGTLPNPSEDLALPHVEWDDTPAAAALADLVERFGYRVVFQPTTNTVLVAQAGVGAELPEGSYTNTAPARMISRTPDTLRFVGAPATFVAAILLEAVGEDLDGSIVPIGELSYRPGEETCKRYGFHYFNVRLTKEWRAKGKTLEDCRIAAAKSLYKWYRVTAIDPVTQKDLKVEGLDQFKDVDGNKIEVFDGEQIVPLPVVLGSDRDEERKFYIDAPRVYGVRTDNLYTVQSSADTRYTLPFSIDSDRRLVIFDQTMVRDNVFNQVVNRFVKAGIGFAPLPRVLEAAELVLVTSIHVLEPVTRQPVRYQRDRKIPNGSPGTIQTVRREDVQFINFVDYTPGTWKARKVKDNRKECDKAADHYLDGFDRFEDVKTDQRTYPRLIPQLLDGAIQRVTWRCGGGVFTTIARNAERVPWIQPYEFRRGQERLFHQIAENVERVFGIPVGVQLPALPPPT